MFFETIWMTALIFIVGVVLLRLGGRKSISQIAIPQVVVMIGLGTLLIQPVSGHGLGYTFVAAAVLVLLMVLFEFIDLKWDRFETIFTGKSRIVIEHGQLQLENMRKLRLTVDKLEALLRENGIANIKDIEWATLEVSGQLGYSVVPDQQPATKGDLQQILDRLHQLDPSTSPISTVSTPASIFTEVKQEELQKSKRS